MSEIEIHWDDQIENLLVGEMRGPGTWEEFHSFHDRVLEEAKQASAPVVHFAFIVNADTPRGTPFPHYKRAVKKWDAFEHHGEYFVVIPDRLRAIMVSALVKVARAVLQRDDFPVVSSLQEVRERLLAPDTA